MKTILIYSGGLDSTILLYDLIAKGHRIKTLSFDYGQKHKRELHAAEEISAALEIEHHIVDISSILPLIASSSQTSEDVAVPLGHYAAPEMSKTVIPNRNMIMMSIALGWAISSKYEQVAYAAHKGDRPVYRDCRWEFVEAMNKAALLCDEHQVRIVNPYVHMEKAEIVALGLDLFVPIQETYTCYEGGEIQCGVCSTCFERREAFKMLNADDPTEYANPYPEYEAPVFE